MQIVRATLTLLLTPKIMGRSSRKKKNCTDKAHEPGLGLEEPEGSWAPMYLPGRHKNKKKILVGYALISQNLTGIFVLENRFSA